MRSNRKQRTVMLVNNDWRIESKHLSVQIASRLIFLGKAEAQEFDWQTENRSNHPSPNFGMDASNGHIQVSYGGSKPSTISVSRFI